MAKESHRAAKGDGSIAQRPNGTWQFSVGIPSTDGKRKRLYIYAKTRAELRRKITDERARSGGSFRTRSKRTVGQWMETWLEALPHSTSRVTKGPLSPNTVSLYATIWEAHVKTHLADTRLERLNVEAVEYLYAALRRKGTSSAVRSRVAVVMARAIEVAVRSGVHPGPNPFRVVDKPGYEPKEARTLDASEAAKLIKAARGSEFEALWVLLLTSGIRLGEALALQWSDLNIERRTLAVRRSLAEVYKHGAHVGRLKTRGSRRQINLGSLAVDALLRRYEALERRGLVSPYIFTTSTGGHPRRSNLRQRHFQPLLKAAGLKGVTIHGLRHSMTSLMLAQGEPIKTVAARLGHSTTRLTLDRYAHLLAGADRQAADALDSLLGEE